MKKVLLFIVAFTAGIGAMQHDDGYSSSNEYGESFDLVTRESRRKIICKKCGHVFATMRAKKVHYLQQHINKNWKRDKAVSDERAVLTDSTHSE